MTGFVVRLPRGEVPRRSERVVGDNYAQAAENCKVKSGRCDPVKGLQLVHNSLAATINTMFRYRHQDLYNWLVFDRVVDVVRSPVADDTLGRFFYTGDGEPRMSTYDDAIQGAGPYPVAWFVLGVTPPVTAMSINVAGGSAPTEDRAYVYTFRTAYGEESGPSPATVVSGNVDGTWQITSMDVAPPNGGTISAAVANTPLPEQVEVTLDSVFGLRAGEEITFAGVAGMTDLNGTHKLIGVDAGTNKVVVSLVTAQVYSAGTDTWARVAPHNTVGMTKRIYRTVGTNTDYKLVVELPVSHTNYDDTVPASTVSLNQGIQTLGTRMPPADMHSLTLLANNAMAGLSGNQLCMTEQGKPYSWPTANRYEFPGTGIGLVAAGNSVIILTDSVPHIATSTVPEAASLSKISGEAVAPCVSKTGIVDVGGAALYPGHDGLYLATTAGVKNITANLFTMDEWQLLMPATFRSAYYDSMYCADHETATGRRMLMIDTREPDSTVHCNEVVDAIYANPWDGRLYVAKANQVFQWDADNLNRYVSSWRSKLFQLPKKVNMVAAQVHARFQDIIALNNAALDFNTALIADVDDVHGGIGEHEIGIYDVAGSGLMDVPQQTEGYVQFTLLRDGEPVFSKQISSDKAFKLPGGKKSELYAFEIASSVGWESVNVAESMAELRQVP